MYICTDGCTYACMHACMHVCACVYRVNIGLLRVDEALSANVTLLCSGPELTAGFSSAFCLAL